MDNERIHYEDDRVTFWDKRVVSDGTDFKEVFRSVTILPAASWELA